MKGYFFWLFMFQVTTSVLTTNLFKRVHNETITFTSPVKPCLVKILSGR